jgi:hypothetical protein
VNSSIADKIEVSPTNANTHSRLTASILAVALIAFVVALAVAPSPAVDLFWQMRTGQLIAAHHAVPHVDTFSWTRYGHPWIVHEWGMCVLLWAAHQVGGFSVVWVVEAALLIAVFLTLYGFLLRETKFAPITSACLAIWAAKLSSPLISPRPHLFTYLFLILVTAILLDSRRDPSRRGRLWWVVPICAVWANFHGGVILGVGVVAVFGICDLIESKNNGPLAETGRRELIVTGASALALSLNPYGWRIYEIFTQTVGNKTMPSFVSEWSALDFHSALGYLFEALFALIAAGLIFSKERRSLGEIVTVVLLAHASLTASRNVPLFAFAGLLVSARHIQSTLNRLFSSDGEKENGPSLFGSRPPMTIAAVVALAIVLQSAMFAREQLGKTESGGTPLERVASTSFALDYFPHAAVDFVKTEGFPQNWRIYNDYNLGSYLGWRLPERKIFISTQTDVFFGKVLDDYAKLDQQPYNWQSILAPYHPDFALISAAEPQAHLFATSPDWALCWADKPDLDAGGSANALIFVRNTPANADFIARCRRDCPTLRSHPDMASVPIRSGGVAQ